ncbi:coatomer subunit delta [Vairimorpha necatrix]|uniref:Coatomer subunit delta n=1 Tax=Vairimorpha necatrix TaxID=6039 RepID=A0AAX4J9B3_9MICR
MIVGTFIVNKSQIVSRFTDQLKISKIENLILDFMQDPRPLVIKGLFKYIQHIQNNVHYVLITSLNYKENKGRKILEYISNNSTLDTIDQLITIDNVLYNETPIFSNLSLIKNMESQEEKIYKMMMKNKASEIKKKYSQIQSSTSKNEYKERHSHQEEKLITSSKNETSQVSTSSKKTKSFETSKKGIFILLKEKLKCQIDVENTLKNVEINGEMILNIKNESYKNLEIKVKGDISACKFSPKLDKQSCKNNIIRSDKDFSLNKNIALMKWKSQNITNLPISFTFWPSEVKQGTYQVSLEFTAEEDINNLNINIPIKDVIVVDTNLTTNDNFIEWNIGNIKKNDSDSLDFQCKCEDIKKIFPIDVYFTSEKINLEVGDIEIKGHDEDEYEMKKMTEVEEYKIEYE